jgi:UDP-glucose 4-epimerase
LKSFFITGASGFIGQRLLNSLNGNIRVLSRVEQANLETIVCDLQSEIIPANSLEGVDTVFHLAGYAHDVRNASKTKNSYQKINIDSTKRLAQLAIKSNVKRFVFVSSVKAGGLTTSGDCKTEEMQNNPDSVYGRTKRQAELELLDIVEESDMHVSIIRPSLVYGPNVKGNLKAMLSGIKKGWLPPLPETGNKRSMIHVDDVVSAILFLAEDSRADREIFNVTDGEQYSSREIYNTMSVLEGRPILSWSVPKILFDIASFLSPKIKYKVNKLLGDERYSSAKIEALGFKAKKTLKEMNETDY